MKYLAPAQFGLHRPRSAPRKFETLAGEAHGPVSKSTILTMYSGMLSTFKAQASRTAKSLAISSAPTGSRPVTLDDW